MSIVKTVAAVCLLAVATPALAQDAADAGASDASVEAATKRMRAYLDSTTTLKASFRSLLLDERREPLAESVGEMALKRPGRFRWEETAPENALLVTNGVSLWNYDPELEQVVIQEVASLDIANPAQLLGGDADLEKDFQVVGGYRVDDIEWVDVRPRTNTSDFDIVRFGFRGTSLAMMEFHNKIGQITQYVLEDVIANQPIDDDRFTFSPPPGTEIVDGS
ncbi:MAG: outer membrane lipoprotein chaperone LolA [Pseudomonadota bacterium]